MIARRLLVALALVPVSACATSPRAPAPGPSQVATSTSASASASATPIASASATTSASTLASATPTTPPAPPALERGDHAFAARLCGARRAAKGNLVLSPASARVALGMAFVGARGRTASEMANVLGVDPDVEKATKELSASVARWNGNSDPKVKLHVANAAWGERTTPFLTPWLDAMKGPFASPLRPVDFKGAFDRARRDVNDWVAEKTEKKILGILQPGDVDEYTRFVLVNATYFKGEWATAFSPGATRDGAFHVEPGRDVKRPLMHQTRSFGYGETADAQVLSMPYGRGAYSMVVVLPTKTFGLDALEAEMTGAKIDEWFHAASFDREVVVTMPRVEAESRASLVDALRGLGMRDAFDDEAADFTGIAKAPDGNLHLARVIQKAYLKIDEKGTEAAAATAVIGAVPTGVAPPPVAFEATHPFLWFLRDEAGDVLFVGRVAEP